MSSLVWGDSLEKFVQGAVWDLNGVVALFDSVENGLSATVLTMHDSMNTAICATNFTV